MPSIRFQLDAPLARVEAHVRATYGTAARVVSVREVRTGGVGGFFARRTLDVEVDVPAEAHAPGTRGAATAAGHAAAAGSGAPAAGLAGLLAEADAGDGIGVDAPTLPPDFGIPPEQPTRRSMRAAEAAARARPAAPGAGVRTEQPTISTQSRRFAEVLDGVRAEIAPPKPSVPETIRIAPALSRLAGDLVVIAGLGSDAAAVADALADARGPYLRGVGGDLTAPGARADDRRGAIGLRAAGVERGLPALVSFGLGSGGPTLRAAVDALRALAPDQVWVVIDVSRKPEDTVRWVTAVRAAVAVDAMAVISGAFTASENTAATLGLPEGWSDAGR
ncbi:hypothetical protein ACFFGH_22995 [Lysobacter korlensis]|uniref:Uncharacterized protein n=1 Tax=Lysobacter korlensis TaxID=553636 RepID=A0ABV6RVT8_9GAMM